MLIPTNMLYSVVMINRNGGDYLRHALRGLSVALQHALKACTDIEFVLVDNDSSDASIKIAEEEMKVVGLEWRIVHESEPGVNSARLAGLHSARGRYIIFADNDLVFEPGWLTAYLEAIGTHPDCRVFAGRVLVGQVEGDIPMWLDLDGEYSRTSVVPRCDNGEHLIQAQISDSTKHGPIGGNMALERSVLDDHGWFNADFGLRPGSLIAGAEAEFFHRLAKHDETFVYVPGACVYHPFKRNQISKSYFRRRLNGTGRVVARIQRLEGFQAKYICGIKRYLVRELAIAWLRYFVTWFQRCPKKRFFYRCNISIVWGQIQEDVVAS